MNPNFYTSQIKPDFIEAIRKNSCDETKEAYRKAIYQQTAENCLVALIKTNVIS